MSPNMRRHRRRHSPPMSHAGLIITWEECFNMERACSSLVELLLEEGESKTLPLMFSFAEWWARWSFYMAQLDGDPA